MFGLTGLDSTFSYRLPVTLHREPVISKLCIRLLENGRRTDEMFRMQRHVVKLERDELREAVVTRSL